MDKKQLIANTDKIRQSLKGVDTTGEIIKAFIEHPIF